MSKTRRKYRLVRQINQEYWRYEKKVIKRFL